LGHCAGHLEARGRGFIVGVSSIAGERGRPNHCVYGAARGALSLYLEGLRGRLHRSGVRVVTVKPGYTDTAMTWGRQGLRWVRSPEDVAIRIVRSISGGPDVVYAPGFWRWVMLGVRWLPDGLFKRLGV